MRMRVVVPQLEILEAEGEQVVHRGIDLHVWQRVWRARQLQVRLLSYNFV